VNDELEGIWKEAQLRSCPSIYSEGLGKITKYLRVVFQSRFELGISRNMSNMLT
jgi:hypothetical protein